MRSPIVLAALALCACASPRLVVPGVPVASLDTEALPARLPPPQTAGEAQALLAASLSALRADKPTHAALFLKAIARSDHLTDRGRANVYWLLAEAQRARGDEAGITDALGGFLVAAMVLPEDDEIVWREVQARATLLAQKVARNPTLGKSPDFAIPIEDRREAAGVIRELGCGPSGEAPYVEGGVASHHDVARTLEERRLLCSDDGRELVLWFDVTSAAPVQ